MCEYVRLKGASFASVEGTKDERDCARGFNFNFAARAKGEFNFASLYVCICTVVINLCGVRVRVYVCSLTLIY